jgi:succinylglutamic semialdehyde dehydrogenase
MKPQAFEPKGNYIHGKFESISQTNNQIESISPADLSDRIGSFATRVEDVDRAVESAHHAWKTWKRSTLEYRKEKLLKLKEVFEKRKEEIASIIARETGKPFWESRAEAAILAGKIKVTCEESYPRVAEEVIEEIAPGTTGRIMPKPHGVMTILGPFNFPCHLPNGHLIPALLTGNTVVFKPSEKTPGSGQMLAECIHEAGFPEGVFQLVQGEAEVGKALISHPDVRGVLFTGSYGVGRQIKESLLDHPRKICALEMGGKNATVVLDDADLEGSVYQTLFGAFATAGQRCSCTSRLILQKGIAERFLELFQEQMESIRIGAPFSEPQPFMGPLISKEAREGFLNRLKKGRQEKNVEVLKEAEIFESEKDGFFVTPSLYLVNNFDSKSIYQNEEHFGPHVSAYVVDNLEKAAELANASDYGLSHALFSNDEKSFRFFQEESLAGIVNWNKPTCGASGRLPFGGTGKSGNHRPTGVTAVHYTSYPLASLESDSCKLPDSEKRHSGLWEES